MTPDQCREYIRKIVVGAPPLTEEQRANLRQLLRPGVQTTKAAS